MDPFIIIISCMHVLQSERVGVANAVSSEVSERDLWGRGLSWDWSHGNTTELSGVVRGLRVLTTGHVSIHAAFSA